MKTIWVHRFFVVWPSERGNEFVNIGMDTIWPKLVRDDFDFLLISSCLWQKLNPICHKTTGTAMFYYSFLYVTKLKKETGRNRSHFQLFGPLLRNASLLSRQAKKQQTKSKHRSSASNRLSIYASNFPWKNIWIIMKYGFKVKFRRETAQV